MIMSACRNASIALLGATLLCHSLQAWSQTTKPPEPLNRSGLTVALQECSKRAVVSADKAAAYAACSELSTSMFELLDEFRLMPRMRQHVWGACAEASGYTSTGSPESIVLFAGCAGLMSKRCLTGRMDGGELSPVDCMAAIHSMAWVPQVIDAMKKPAHTKR